MSLNPRTNPEANTLGWCNPVECFNVPSETRVGADIGLAPTNAPFVPRIGHSATHMLHMDSLGAGRYTLPSRLDAEESITLEHMKRNIALLAICQALATTNVTILVALSALVGFSLADNKLLATLPVASVMVGTMLCTVPAAFWMRRVGRKFGFMTGLGIGMAGAARASQITR